MAPSSCSAAVDWGCWARLFGSEPKSTGFHLVLNPISVAVVFQPFKGHRREATTWERPDTIQPRVSPTAPHSVRATHVTLLGLKGKSPVVWLCADTRFVCG
ncbi:unnamed protein product [Pylaiella littoralis]